MDANELLRQMTIPAPCQQDWNAMHGDQRKRFCESCGKHVYDLTAMAPAEVVTLIENSEAGLCARAFREKHGTLFIPEQAPGVQPAAGHWQFHLRSVMTVIAAVAAMLGFARLIPKAPDPAVVTTPAGITPVIFTGELDRMSPAKRSPASRATFWSCELPLPEANPPN